MSKAPVTDDRGATLSVFPNPTTSSIAIQSSNVPSGLVELTVFDVVGRRVFIEPFTVGEDGDLRVSLDVSSWATGMYFVRASASEDALVLSATISVRR